MTAVGAKVVFDTNILISAHFWKGPPYRCLLAAEARLVVLILSDPIVAELREKLVAKFALSAAEVEAILDQLSTHADRVQVHGRSGWIPQDPDDDKFIDTALSSGAAIIVSGDRHLLALGTVEGIESSRRDSFSIGSRPRVQEYLQIRRRDGRQTPGLRRPTLRSENLRQRWRASRLPSLRSALRGLDPRHALPNVGAFIGASGSYGQRADVDRSHVHSCARSQFGSLPDGRDSAVHSACPEQWRMQQPATASRSASTRRHRRPRACTSCASVAIQALAQARR